MKNRISLNCLMKMANICFLLILENFVLDCGAGYLAVGIIFYAFFYTILMGSMQSSVAKMVSIRNHKGLYNNSRKILKNSILYVLITGTVFIVLTFLLSEKFCLLFFGTSNPTPVIQSFSFLVLLNGLTDVLTGFQMGSGNGILVNISHLCRIILPLGGGLFLVNALYHYGLKVAGLLQNGQFANLYGAIGGVLIQILTSFLVLIICLIWFKKSEKNSVERNGYGSLRGIDSDRRLFKNFIALSFKTLENSIIPVMMTFLISIMYMHLATKYGVHVNEIFRNLGIFFVKFGLVCVLIYTVFKEYVIREKYKLHTDFKKEEMKGFLTRSQYLIKNTFFMLLPAACILIFLADPFVKVFFSDEIKITVKMFRIGGILLLLGGLTYTLKTILISMQKNMTVFIMNAGSMLVQIVFLWIGLSKSRGNSMFLLYSLFVYFGICLLGYAILIYKMIQPNLVDILIKVGKVTVAASVMAVVEVILDTFIMMNVFLMFLAIALCYLVFYLVLFAIRGISKKDEQSLKWTINYIPVHFIADKLRLW